MGCPAVEVEPGIRVLRQSTLAPGHRSGAAQWIDARRLEWTLRAIPEIGISAVIAMVPWQWPAVGVCAAPRRVFDCGDDWRSLIPRRSAAIDALYLRIAREAEAVIVTSAELSPAFPGAEVTVVGNGASSELLHAPTQPLPCEHRMVYAGTLSERFDAPLLAEVLERLPGWSAELYGVCQYAGHGTAPGPELRALLDDHRGRVRWHGPVEREQLAAVLDRARVLIAPHRAALTRGQDSMKLYDYAARDRPIVCTPRSLGDRSHTAPAGVVEAATAAEFAVAVDRAVEAGPGVNQARRAWVSMHSWSARWPAWAQAALDLAPPAEGAR